MPSARLELAFKPQTDKDMPIATIAYIRLNKSVFPQTLHLPFAALKKAANAQTQFELQVMLAATSDARLGRKLTAALDAEVDRLAALFTDRRIDGARPKRTTTAAEGRLVASAIKATMTGFALR